MTEGDIMGSDKSLQFTSQNGCVYRFNYDEEKWYKFCPTDELPLDVIKQVKEIREKADLLKDA